MSEHLGSDTSHGVDGEIGGVRTGPDHMAMMAAARRSRGVPVGPLAEAYERSGRTLAEVAREMGWVRCVTDRRYAETRVYRRPDTDRLRRQLGLKTYSPGRGYPPRLREYMTYDTALKLVKVLDVYPVEVGL